jgi:elongation factor G
MMDQGRKMTYMRIYSGSIKVGDTVYNPGKNIKEKLARILKMHSNKRERIEWASAGDIIAVMGLKSTTTGDTICTEESPILLEPIQVNEPVISIAIEPKKVQDQDRLMDSLRKLSDEDPTFKYRIDDETGQTVLSGMGELHLEIITGRIKREFSVDTNQGKPQVVYRETITQAVTREEAFEKELAGQQHFAGVTIEILPRPRGQGNRFVDRCKNADLTELFIQAIQEGIEEAVISGSLMGYPVIDVETSLLDIKVHEINSDAMAFKVAAELAFQNASKQANAILLEPIMETEILVPEEFMGEVIGDLHTRQGKIKQIAAKGPIQVISASVPLSRMFGYSTALRSVSQGRGTFSMQFSHYDNTSL